MHDPKLRQIIMSLWLCAIALVVTSCATYQSHDLNPATSEAAFRDRSLSDPGLYAFVCGNSTTKPSRWPPRQFDLEGLTLAALYFHPDLEVARAKLASARAALITAGARPNPTFGFSPTFSEPPIEFFSPWTLGFTLDVPIETAGKRGYRIGQAQYLANSARLDVANTAWLVRSRVRGSLLDLYAANLNVELLEKQQAVQTQTVEVLEDRFKAGQSSLFEVQLVRVSASQTTLQFRDAQKQRNQARVRLADALGVGVNALSDTSFSYEAFNQFSAPQDAEASRREALLNRPDILGALAEYQASQAALQLEVAKQYPDFHLGPGYTWNQGVNNYSLGISLTLPVFNKNQGPIAEAEAHRRQGAAAFTALQARVIAEVDSALAGYRDARSKLQTADELLAAQQERMRRMRESFTAGAADRLELLQTELELHTSELSRAAALVETQQAIGALDDALRRPSRAVGNSRLPLPLINRKSN
jgi:outer membrane protein TolC